MGGGDYYVCHDCDNFPVYCIAKANSKFFSYFCSTCKHFHPQDKKGNIKNCDKIIKDDNDKDKKCNCKSYVRSTTCGYCGKIRDLHWYWK